MNQPKVLRASMAGTLLIALAGCAVPAEYMGIDTRTPIPPAARLQIAEVLASGTPVLAGCPWLDLRGELVSVPCDLVPLSQLAGFAWTANKPAALELGIRFEEGRGVPRDLEKARKLYRIAAMSTGGTSFYFSPGSEGRPSQLIPLFSPEEPGLAEARARLQALPPPADPVRRRSAAKR